MHPTESESPNTWTPQQAAEWAGISYRLLLNFFDRGLLPAIRVGEPVIQNMGRGKKKRKRRAGKWIVPAKAFQTCGYRKPRPD
jgi:hypothetical protein